MTEIHALNAHRNSDTGDGLNLTFEVDILNQITAITPNASASPEQARHYHYDALGRLIGVATLPLPGPVPMALPILRERYHYDTTGNRLSKHIGLNQETYHYADTSHHLTGIGTELRQYDAAGLLSQRGDQHFTHADDQRLKQLRIGTQLTHYQHNGRGERSSKQHGDQSHDYLYDEQGRLVAEYHQHGQQPAELARQYVWLDDRPIATRSRHGHHANTWLHIHSDHLGTPRAITKPSQNHAVIWHWPLTGSAFGDHPPNPDPHNTGNPYTFNLRYPGQYFDAESGLHYNYFRDYEPQTGRYIQSDPIGLGGGISTYGYVDSMPLTSIDPSGLIRIIPCEDCDRREMQKVRQSVQEWCDWAARGSNIKDVSLRRCIMKRCRRGTVACKSDCRRRMSCGKDIGVPRGYYIPEEDPNPVICLNSVEPVGGWGSTAIHEIAHSCGWQHGQGGGVPNDPGPHTPCPPDEDNLK